MVFPLLLGPLATFLSGALGSVGVTGAAAGVAALGIGACLVVKYWNEIIDWLSEFITKLKSAFAELGRTVKHAAVIMGQKIRDMYARIMHKQYYQEQGKWFEETTTREISEDEVPPQILAKIRAQETDITREMEQELQMTV